MSTLYDFTLPDAQGHDIDFSRYQGKVLLIVNTATRCGLTPQYTELQALHRQFHERGLEILDFPCNQFRDQAPETSSEIATLCQTQFGTEFTTFKKIKVNGAEADPLYIWLKTQQPEDHGGKGVKEFLLKLASLGEKREGSNIKWNFTKFLINRQGEVINRFAPSMPPAELAADIEALL